jgi:transposase InsO family protein
VPWASYPQRQQCTGQQDREDRLGAPSPCPRLSKQWISNADPCGKWGKVHNGRLHDECLNEHWFTSLSHARSVIEAWRREYNEERPKRILGGLTPAEHARRLTEKVITMPGKL